jgi:hypothetical protein
MERSKTGASKKSGAGAAKAAAKPIIQEQGVVKDSTVRLKSGVVSESKQKCNWFRSKN